MQNIKSQFLLRDDITYLNFGSFGACAKPVFENYQSWQLELEQEPVQFMMFRGPELLRRSREVLGKFLNCNADDLVYTMNPSYGVNLIAKSFDLKAGDKVLTTDLEYGACDKTWKYYCEKAGAKYIQTHIELPLTSKENFVDQFFKGVTSNTRLIFISHITSSTALIFPVKEICNKARELGIITFVDGAHGPGHIPLDLNELGADIYTGACHKWMMTPKGCSFLYVRKELQHLFDPLIISWGFDSPFTSGSKFIDYHQLQGTRDISAFLTVEKAIEFMRENNWTKKAKECRQIVQKNAERFCELFGTRPLSPVTDEFLGQMFSIPIHTDEPEKLQRLLFEKYKIEIPVMRHAEHVFLRYSVQAFNSQDDLNKLYYALREIIQAGEFIAVASTHR